jgi:polar amino acid transport system substrate-binding protein
MTSPSRRLAALVIGAGLMVTAAACSSSSTTTTTSASGSATSKAPLNKELPAAIRQAGVINVGTSVAFPPYDFNTAGSSTVIGFEPDLEAAIGKLLGVQLKLDVVQFPELVPGVQDHRFDMAIDGVSDSKAREKLVDFVDYGSSGIVILVPTAKAAGVTSLLDICGHSIAYAVGTYGQQTANDLVKMCAAAHKAPITKTAFPDAPSIQLALESGRIDYELEDTATGGYDAKVSNGKITSIPVPASQATGDFAAGLFGVVVPKADRQLSKAIQAALTTLQNNGSYARILAKWGVTQLAVKQITFDTPSY